MGVKRTKLTLHDRRCNMFLPNADLVLLPQFADRIRRRLHELKRHSLGRKALPHSMTDDLIGIRTDPTPEGCQVFCS
jgi:hypothetical protein